MKNRNPNSIWYRFLPLVLLSALVLLLCGCVAEQPAISTTEPNDADELSRLNGIPLSRFTIVYSTADHDYSERAARYIQTEIAERTGLQLPLAVDSEKPASNYEIVVGETSREISGRLTAPESCTQFSILAEDTNIALEGEYFVIAAAAYYFIETYIPADDYSAEIPTGITVCDPIVDEVENLIVMIGDGMGVNTTKLFDVNENNIAYGDGEDIFYGYYLPYHGYSRTDSLSGVTDSAAGGTALACGIKTINYYVGQDQYHNPVQSLTELAGSLGKATAVMSTEERTGATPGAFSAHADDRYAKNQIITSQQELMDQYGTKIVCDYNHFKPKDVEEIRTTFDDMLHTLDDNENGFFIMYEEAYTDKYGHQNNMVMAFHALVRFNQVIATAMEYAFYHPGTMVIITADHETGGLTASGDTYVYTTEEHTGVDVPVFVYGMGCEVFDEKTVENVQIAQTLACFMGVYDFGDQTEWKPLINAP